MTFDLPEERLMAGRLFVETGRRLATKVMANGVEVIIKGNQNQTGLFGVQGPTPVFGGSIVTTLPPTTVSNQFHLMDHPNKKNTAIDHLLHSMARSATPEFVTKTLMTTFTLLQTVLQNDSTIVNTREETISNVVTEPKFQDETVFPSIELAGTFTASPIYAFTSIDTPHLITPHLSTFTFSKTLHDINGPHVVTQVETLTHIGVTRTHFPVTFVQSFSQKLVKIFYTTFTTFLTSYDGTSEVISTSTSVTSNVVTATPTLTHYPQAIEAQITDLETILPSIESEIEILRLKPVMIYATKTFYTTTTFLTSILGDGNVTKIESRTTVVSNVVTEAISTVLDDGYLLALKSSYLAEHGHVTHVTTTKTQPQEIIFTMHPDISIRTIEGTYVPDEPSRVIFPHWPKDDDMGILDPLPVVQSTQTLNAPEMHELRSEINLIIHDLVSGNSNEGIRPTKTQHVYATQGAEENFMSQGPTPPLMSTSINVTPLDEEVYHEEVNAVTVISEDEPTTQELKDENVILKFSSKGGVNKSSGTVAPIMVFGHLGKPNGEAHKVFNLISSEKDNFPEKETTPDYYDEIKEETAFKETGDDESPEILNQVYQILEKKTTKEETTTEISLETLQQEILDDIPTEESSNRDSTERVMLKFTPRPQPSTSVLKRVPTKPTKSKVSSKPLPLEDYDDVEPSGNVYNLVLPKPPPSGSDSNSADVETAAAEEDNQNEESDEQDDHEHRERRPSFPTNGNGPPHLNFNLAPPVPAPAPEIASPVVTSTGVNWAPLLKLGAVGLGGLGASTITKWSPLLTSMAGFLRNGLVPILARNDTHHPHIESLPNQRRPFRGQNPHLQMQMAESSGLTIPRRPIVTHANEANFRFENGPNFGAHRNRNQQQQLQPMNMHVVLTPIGNHDKLSSPNMVKVVSGNPINAPRPQNVVPQFPGRERRPMRPPPRSQEISNWTKKIILPFPPQSNEIEPMENIQSQQVVSKEIIQIKTPPAHFTNAEQQFSRPPSQLKPQMMKEQTSGVMQTGLNNQEQRPYPVENISTQEKSRPVPIHPTLSSEEQSPHLVYNISINHGQRPGPLSTQLTNQEPRPLLRQHFPANLPQPQHPVQSAEGSQYPRPHPIQNVPFIGQKWPPAALEFIPINQGHPFQRIPTNQDRTKPGQFMQSLQSTEQRPFYVNERPIPLSSDESLEYMRPNFPTNHNHLRPQIIRNQPQQAQGQGNVLPMQPPWVDSEGFFQNMIKPGGENNPFNTRPQPRPPHLIRDSSEESGRPFIKINPFSNFGRPNLQQQIVHTPFSQHSNHHNHNFPELGLSSEESNAPPIRGPPRPTPPPVLQNHQSQEQSYEDYYVRPIETPQLILPEQTFGASQRPMPNVQQPRPPQPQPERFPLGQGLYEMTPDKYPPQVLFPGAQQFPLNPPTLNPQILLPAWHSTEHEPQHTMEFKPQPTPQFPPFRQRPSTVYIVEETYDPPPEHMLRPMSTHSTSLSSHSLLPSSNFPVSSYPTSVSPQPTSFLPDTQHQLIIKEIQTTQSPSPNTKSPTTTNMPDSSQFKTTRRPMFIRRSSTVASTPKTNPPPALTPESSSTLSYGLFPQGIQFSTNFQQVVNKGTQKSPFSNFTSTNAIQEESTAKYGRSPEVGEEFGGSDHILFQTPHNVTKLSLDENSEEEMSLSEEEILGNIFSSTKTPSGNTNAVNFNPNDLWWPTTFKPIPKDLFSPTTFRSQVQPTTYRSGNLMRATTFRPRHPLLSNAPNQVPPSVQKQPSAYHFDENEDLKQLKLKNIEIHKTPGFTRQKEKVNSILAFIPNSDEVEEEDQMNKVDMKHQKIKVEDEQQKEEDENENEEVYDSYELPPSGFPATRLRPPPPFPEPPDEKHIRRPPTNERRPPINEANLPANERNQLLNHGRPPNSIVRPVGTEKRPITNERRPLTNPSRPLPNERRPLPNERRPPTNERRPLTDERIPPNNEHRPLGNEERPLANERIPPTNEHGPQDNERGPLTNERRPQPNEGRPLSEMRPTEVGSPQTNEGRPLTNDGRPLTNERGSPTNHLRPQTDDKEPPSNHLRPQTGERGPPTNHLKPQTDERGPPTNHLRPQTDERGPPTNHLRSQTDERGPPTNNLRPQTNEGGSPPNNLTTQANEKESPTNSLRQQTNERVSPTNGRGPQINETRPYNNERRPLTNEERPPTNERRPLTNEGRPPINERRPLANEGRPPINERRPLANEGRPPTNERRPLTNEGRPPANERRPLTNERNPITNERNPLTNDGRPTTNERRPLIQRPSPPTQRPGVFESLTNIFRRPVHSAPGKGPSHNHNPLQGQVPSQDQVLSNADQRRPNPQSFPSITREKQFQHPISSPRPPIIFRRPPQPPTNGNSRPDFIITNNFHKANPIPLNPMAQTPPPPNLQQTTTSTISTTVVRVTSSPSAESYDGSDGDENEVEKYETSNQKGQSEPNGERQPMGERPGSDLRPAADGDPFYESEEEGIQSPEVNYGNRHVGGHLANIVFQRNPPIRQQHQGPKEGNNRERDELKVELEPPPIDSLRLKPPVMELPSNGPIRIRPRPNLLRPEETLLRPEEPVQLKPSFHTIATVDDENKIVRTNLIPAFPIRPPPPIQPTRTRQKVVETQKPIIIGSVETVSLKGLLPEEKTKETPSIIKYSSGVITTLPLAANQKTSIPEVTTQIQPTRSLPRTPLMATIQRGTPSPPTLMTRIQTPTTTTEVTRSEESQGSIKVTLSEGRPIITSFQPDESPIKTPPPYKPKKPFMPIRNPLETGVIPPWRLRTTTTTTSTTLRARLPYKFTRPSSTTTTPTDKPTTEEIKSEVSSSTTEASRLNSVSEFPSSSTTTIGSSSTTNVDVMLSSFLDENSEELEEGESEMAPTTFRPASRPNFPRPGSPRQNSTTATVITKDGEVAVVRKVTVSTASSISTKLPVPKPTSTRYVTHTETLTQTITETETTILPSTVEGLEQVTQTIIMTKILPPETLISTILGTVTVVNTVQVEPTTVRTTIFSQPTQIVTTLEPSNERKKPVVITQPTPPSSLTNEKAEDKLFNAGVGILIRKPRPPLLRDLVESTTTTTTTTTTTRQPITERTRSKNHLEGIGCTKTNCSIHGNQFCRGNGTHSKCVCKPGYARMKSIFPCRPTFIYEMSLGVRPMEGGGFDPRDFVIGSEGHDYFMAEAKEALENAFLTTDINRQFQGTEVMGVKPKASKMYVDFLVQLTVNMTEDRIRNHLLGTLKHSNFSIGRVGLLSPDVMADFTAKDFNECSHPDYHDCSPDARCINLRGSFTCECKEGFKDKNRRHKQGRDCSGLAGCRECNYKGNCYRNKFGNNSCDCFRWHGGPACNWNLKILLMGVIGVGTLLFFLVIVCGVILCRRKTGTRRRERAGSEGSKQSGRFMRYRSPTSQATLERTAIMHDSASSSSVGTEENVQPLRMNNSSYTPDSLVEGNTALKIQRKNENASLINFSLRNVNPSPINLVIPRAKIRRTPHSQPSSGPGPSRVANNQGVGRSAPTETNEIEAEVSERKLISYLEADPSKPPSSTIQREKAAKAFRKLSLQERRISTGALVSSGTEVSARGGMRRRSTGLEPDISTRVYEKASSDARSSRTSCYNCKPPSYCGYSESAGHTMAEKDGSSTVYTVQGRLFRMTNESDSNVSSD